MSDCCSVPNTPTDNSPGNCPTCHIKGMPVAEQTIRALTKKEYEFYDSISDGFLCRDPEDDTVYFFDGLIHTITRKDLMTRVGFKEKSDPIPVCYCFQHTKKEIEDDVIRHGHSTIEISIREKVKQKLCSCEIKNPSGKCCLGDVRKVINGAEKSSKQRDIKK